MQTALYHYVRGAALAGLGRAEEADAARTALAEAAERVPADLMISPPNAGRAIVAVAAADLAGGSQPPGPPRRRFRACAEAVAAEDAVGA
ncbi:MAG: hypothetical protein R2712_25580 [Vicinamibacterales bacterium]